MSSSDKTGEKLLASIRKTKAGGKPAETPAGSADASGRGAPVKKTPARKTTVRKKVAARKTPAKRAAQPAVGAYQSARRVWPD